jgi:hypothetical protein
MNVKGDNFIFASHPDAIRLAAAEEWHRVARMAACKAVDAAEVALSRARRATAEESAALEELRAAREALKGSGK